MKAQDFAKQAAEILGQRGTDNGYDAGEERSAATIAKVFNLVAGRDLTEQEAWLFLICLKLVREGRKHQPDNCVDMANYSLLRAESFSSPDDKAPFEGVSPLGGCPKIAEFINHDGGACPVPGDTEVVCVLREGFQTRVQQAKNWDWIHRGMPSDIMGYYVVGSVASVHDEIQVAVSKPGLLTPQQIDDYMTGCITRATKPGGILFKK